jgi:capsule polysaccharide export protein KpsE/RkpR
MIEKGILLNLIKKRIKTIVSIVLGFIFFGIMYVVITPKTFTTTISLIPEPKEGSAISSSVLSQFSGITGLSNMDLGNEEAIRPDLYPTIIESTTFLINLSAHKFNHPLYGDSLNLIIYIENHLPIDYLNILKKYTIGLPNIFINKFKSSTIQEEIRFSFKKDDNDFYLLSFQELMFLKDVSELVNVNFDKKTGELKIQGHSTDPFISSIIAQFTRNYIMDFVTTYRINKRKNNIEYLTNKKEELELNFLREQKKYADFRENNFNLSRPNFQSLEENIRSSYELSKTLFFSINTQLEQSKIKLNEITPVFLELQPIVVPTIKSRPQTMLILILSTVIGFICSSIFVLLSLDRNEF